mmetsp:Transcript_30900/g.71990  ORF Transcript_30900/g.71990 Transcript_30900/m.71990 type:complete len:237 (+) Transcript_30900:1388-2098(+)
MRRRSPAHGAATGPGHGHGALALARYAEDEVAIAAGGAAQASPARGDTRARARHTDGQGQLECAGGVRTAAHDATAGTLSHRHSRPARRARCCAVFRAAADREEGGVGDRGGRGSRGSGQAGGGVGGAHTTVAAVLLAHALPHALQDAWAAVQHAAVRGVLHRHAGALATAAERHDGPQALRRPMPQAQRRRRLADGGVRRVPQLDAHVLHTDDGHCAPYLGGVPVPLLHRHAHYR